MADDQTKFKIYNTYQRARICRWMSVAFALVGLGLFAALYQRYVAPDIVAAFSDLSILFIFVFPFVPTVICMLLGKRYEKRYLALSAKE